MNIRDKSRLRVARETLRGVDHGITRDQAEALISQLDPVKDGTSTVGVAVGADRFRRTAIKLQKGATSSVDVLDHEGNTVARLNICKFSGREANIDVILAPNAKRTRVAGVVKRAHPTHDHKGRVLRFSEGLRTTHDLGENESIVAVTFNYPKKGE